MLQCGPVRMDQMQRRRAAYDRMGPFSECDFMLWQYGSYDGFHGIPLWPKNQGATLSLEWHITLLAFVRSCFLVCSFLIISHNVPCVYTCWCCGLCAQTMAKENPQNIVMLRALLWTSNARRKLIFGLRHAHLKAWLVSRKHHYSSSSAAPEMEYDFSCVLLSSVSSSVLTVLWEKSMQNLSSLERNSKTERFWETWEWDWNLT